MSSGRFCAVTTTSSSWSASLAYAEAVAVANIATKRPHREFLCFILPSLPIRHQALISPIGTKRNVKTESSFPGGAGFPPCIEGRGPSKVLKGGRGAVPASGTPPKRVGGSRCKKADALPALLWIQQLERREGLLEAEGLRAEYFERLLRSPDRRRADAENLDALSVLETLCCNRLSGRCVEYCNQAGH